MKNVAIFSDVDGTIYPFPGRELPRKNKEKVNEITKKGVHFVISTGNGPYEKIKKLADELGGRYISFSNGAFLYDNHEKKVLNIEYIDLQEAKKVWDLASELNLPLYYFGTDRFFLKNATKEQKDFFTNFCEYNKWIENGEIPSDLHKIETYGDPELLKKFSDLAIERGINLNIVNLEKHIEITKPGVSKGSGLKWFCENIFKIPLSDVMAIGDSQNDISMFEIAGFSYAMENTDPYTMRFAKFYTSTVEQSGLAEAIDDYLYRVDWDLKREISQRGMIKEK
ncbi:hypothetical protein MCANUF31_00768 [Mycoplasmopsis canis UF31]|uniref:Cof-type HAD-IIB family hydrolase n=1 Tax=Mycoplasmopsis canis TaxID=29555 RepID=UPI00025AEC57|nr:Cof-type HAD-IIB family hydrolase [Mycoplasmopsis canis]EIE40361.1 hypothetical protein MCANUF31_00768 [Mycoplasmopsis canis UF31]WQQ12546.1 Cof-type HAD-IIB family hydrolase [Mycoplasmopsis canis]